MDGIHLLGEWHGCHTHTPELNRAGALREACLQAVAACGLTPVGECFFQFEPHGVTGAVILAESHLAIHTWPESGFVTIDVYVCNYTTDNSAKAQKLYERIEAVFKPARAHCRKVSRGGKDD